MHIFFHALLYAGPPYFKLAESFLQIVSSLKSTYDMGPLPDEFKKIIDMWSFVLFDW